MRYPLGTSVWLGGAADPTTGAATPLEIRDSTGALADASTIVFTLIRPDATTINYPTPTHDSLGKYHQVLPLADTVQLGSYKWYVTVLVGAFQTVLPHNSFDVFTPSEVALLTLAEARAQLGYRAGQTSDDVEIQSYIDAITGAVESYLNEIVVQRTITDVLDLRGYRRFWLRSLPAISLASVKSLEDGTVYPVTGFHLTGSSGRVTVLPGGLYPRGLTEVVEVAGYTLIPENYKRGAGIVLQDEWSTQRGASAQPAFGGEVIDTSSMMDTVRRARQWFGPPRAMVA